MDLSQQALQIEEKLLILAFHSLIAPLIRAGDRNDVLSFIL